MNDLNYIYFQGRKKCLTEKGKEKLIELYNAGLNYVSIGKEMGVGEEVMTRWAKELQLTDRRRKYHFNENYFANINSKEKAYWLGFLSADGCVNQERQYVYLELQEGDFQHIEKFRLALQSYDQQTKPIQNNGFLHYRFTAFSKTLVQDLAKYNIVQNKSLVFSPPTNISTDLLPYWIIGYMDGDGCVYLAKGRLKINFIGTNETCKFLKEYFNSNNTISQAHNCQNNTYSFTLEVELSEAFLKQYNYDNLDFALERKKQIYASFIQQ